MLLFLGSTFSQCPPLICFSSSFTTFTRCNPYPSEKNVFGILSKINDYIYSNYKFTLTSFSKIRVWIYLINVAPFLPSPMTFFHDFIFYFLMILTFCHFWPRLYQKRQDWFDDPFSFPFCVCLVLFFVHFCFLSVFNTLFWIHIKSSFIFTLWKKPTKIKKL